jgi:hypothetical protein
MRTARYARVGLSCATLAWLTASPTASAAVPAGQFGLVVALRPASGGAASYFKLHARAGQHLTVGRIVLVNDSAQRMRVVLDEVDAQTISTLGSTYLLPGTPMRGSTRWLRLSRRHVTLDPGSQASVTVAAKVSPIAKAGDYLSGVSIEVPSRKFASTPTRGVSILSSERYAIGVELVLPGPRHPLVRFTGARVERQPAGLRFLLLARNSGNSILQDTHGWARITRADRLIAHVSIGPGTFVTGTAIAFPVAAAGQTPTPGTTYQIAALVRYHGGIARLNTTVTFARSAAVEQHRYGGPPVPRPVPWWRSWQALLIAGGAILSAAGLALVLLLVARRRRSRTPAAALIQLDRALIAAHQNSEQLSIIVLTLTTGGSLRQLASAVGPRMRRADNVYELAGDRLLIISPATSERAASALSSDLGEVLATHPGHDPSSIEITTATTDQPISATELLGQLAPPAVPSPA